MISQGKPVQASIFVYSEFVGTADRSYDPAVDQGAVGGHAIMLTGYRTSGGHTVFTFKNSWGADWGRGGYGTISDTLLTQSWSSDPGYDVAIYVGQ